MDSSFNGVFFLYLICFFHGMMMLTFTTCSDAAMGAAQMEVEVEMKMGRCSTEQSSALLEFKSYFNFSESASSPCGDYLNPPMASWKEGTDCCSSWDGITCDEETGQVVGIDLSSGCLQGNIPPNTTVFHHFPHLQELYLDSNDFRGSRIPSYFGHLSRLKHLDLRSSGFSGEIPMELSYLTQATYLNLAYNDGLRFKKTGFQLLIQNLTKISGLELSSINISSAVPISFLNLTSSEVLVLDECELRGQLPDGMFNLPHLKVLDVGHNSLLTGNFLKFINSSNSLELLDATQCNIYGTIPAWLGNLTKISNIYLSNNYLSGPLPSQLTGLPHLRSLALDHNYITGTIPPLLFALPALSFLQLSCNMFTGHVNEINSSSLRVINLQYNKLTGTIGSSMFCNQNVQILDVSKNNFSGVIPKCVGNLSDLKVLDLGSNNFFGNVPDTFMRGNQLVTIKLHDNKFQGLVPKSLVNCTFLEVLDLGRNNFSDKYPQWLENLTKLRVLILRANRLHGPISISKSKYPFPSLRVMDLSENCFTGPVPTTYFRNFIAMMNISEANYERKYIGFIRGYYFDSLTMVIKGSVVEMKRVLTIFTAIDLSRNKLEGEIPETIGELTSVRGLNLSHNHLRGRIPKSLGNVTALEWLDLSSNKLVGEIPTQLTALNFLKVLNLSHNQLAGRIPQGQQFDTFLTDSYVGNLGLCGPPMSKSCSNPQAPQPPKEKDLQSSDGFDWEIILSGCGCGLVLGLVMGYLMFSTGKPRKIMRIIEGVENKCKEWQKKQTRGQSCKCRRNYGRH